MRRRAFAASNRDRHDEQSVMNLHFSTCHAAADRGSPASFRPERRRAAHKPVWRGMKVTPAAVGLTFYMRIGSDRREAVELVLVSP